VPQLGEDESYRLEVFRYSCAVDGGQSARCAARTTDLPATGQNYASGFQRSAVTIDDQPRFPWRGLMIDVGRHFILSM